FSQAAPRRGCVPSASSLPALAGPARTAQDGAFATSSRTQPMLHPQARALIDLMAERGVPPTHTLAPLEARALYRDRRAYTQPAAPEVAEVRDLQAAGPHGDIPLRSYRPAGAAPDAVLPVLVYYHGGGWVIGDLDTHDTLCRELANGAGCAVVADRKSTRLNSSHVKISYA